MMLVELTSALPASPAGIEHGLLDRSSLPSMKYSGVLPAETLVGERQPAVRRAT
jgi:hypothetical protein